MVPDWSGSVPVQFIFFNSYISNTFLYDKNLAWALSCILNKMYESFHVVYTKTLVPSLLIWFRAGPGPIIENKSPWKKKKKKKKSDMFKIKIKSINGHYQFLCDRRLRITWHRQIRKIWSRVRIPWHGPIFHLHIIKIWQMKKNTCMHFEEESKIYIWSKFQLDTCMFDSNILLTKFGTGFRHWFRVLFLPPKRTGTGRNEPEKTETDLRKYRNGLRRVQKRA